MAGAHLADDIGREALFVGFLEEVRGVADDADRQRLAFVRGFLRQLDGLVHRATTTSMYFFSMRRSMIALVRVDDDATPPCIFMAQLWLPPMPPAPAVRRMRPQSESS